MKRSLELGTLAAALLTLAAGCQTRDSSSQDAATNAQPQTAQKPTEDAEATDVAAAPKTDGASACVGDINTADAKTLKVAGQTWTRNGSTLSLASKPGKGPLKIGAITDIKEDSEKNLKNLEVIANWFKKRNVDLVVVAGDTGESAEQMQAALGQLAALKMPIFHIIGNRAGYSEYSKAMQALAKKHENIFDLSEIRRVDLPQADLISLPGYYDANFIHAKDGCQYSKEHVAELAQLFDAADSPVVMISHGPPRQKGPKAIDRTHEKSNVGDPDLASALKEHDVKLGIFGNVHEAGGRATDLSGKRKRKQGKLYTSLFLNPGPADGVLWQMNDDSQSAGMAAMMTIRGKKAGYRIKRLPLPKHARAKQKKGKKPARRPKK